MKWETGGSPMKLEKSEEIIDLSEGTTDLRQYTAAY